MKKDNRPFVVIACLIFMFISTAVHADLQRNRGVGIYVDQDMFFPLLNEDRDYTMGLALEYFWDKDEAEGFYPLDSVVERAERWMDAELRDDDLVYSFMLGTVNYTPDDLSVFDPIMDDRPYASLIYLSNKRVRVSGTRAVAVELRFGLLGTRLAEQVQRKLHGWTRTLTGDAEPVDPQGWHHQISDGGEPTFRFRFSDAYLHSSEQNTRWDIATSWDLTLGYQTNASVGASARIGELASSFWTLPFDPVNRGNFLPSLSGDEWYVWGAYRARLVAYDALLQGQFRNSDVSFTSSQIKRLVHEGAVGLTLTYKPVQLTFSINAKSSELKGGVGGRDHYWGGVYLMFRQ